MQRILSEDEYIALKNRADQAETKIQELAKAKAEIQTLKSNKGQDWRSHANFWRKKYQSIGRRTINIGTYTPEIANIIAEQLKKMQNNSNLSTAPIKQVRKKGRGHRMGNPRYNTSIPLSLATSQAIYIDLVEPTKEKK